MSNSKKRKRVQHAGGGDSLVQEHFKDAADINNIMARHLRGAPLVGPGRPHARKPQFMDLTGQSFHEMLCKVQDAQGAFAGLPARVRKRFANNPENLFRFLEDPENIKEAVELGIYDEESLSQEQLEQLNLVREADQQDLAKFREWQRKMRASEGRSPAGEEDDDPFEKDTPHQDTKGGSRIPPKRGGNRTS